MNTINMKNLIKLAVCIALFYIGKMIGADQTESKIAQRYADIVDAKLNNQDPAENFSWHDVDMIIWGEIQD